MKTAIIIYNPKAGVSKDNKWFNEPFITKPKDYAITKWPKYGR